MHQNVKPHIRTTMPVVVCLILLFAFSAGVLLVRPASAAATVLYVSTTGSNTSGTGTLASPYATISHAVSVAPTGATIIVLPGAYNEMVTISKKLALESQSSEPSNTIINAAGQPNGIAIFGSTAAGSVIQGLTVENANNHGVYVQDSSGVAIQDNVVTGNGVTPLSTIDENKAIELTGTSNSTVADNTVIGNYAGGIGVDDDGAVDPSWNSTAIPSAGIPTGTPNPANGNIITGNSDIDNTGACSIVLSAYDPGEGVSNTIISNNMVVDDIAGIVVAADDANTQVSGSSVLSNTVVNTGEGGIILHANAAGAVNKDEIISGNVLSNDGSAPTLSGIIVGGESTLKSVAVVNSLITDNSFHNEYYGIDIINANSTSVGGNVMDSTVKVPISGTVITISSVTTTTVAQTTTITQTATVPQTTTITQTATVPQTTTITQTATVPQTTTITQTATVAQTTTFVLVTTTVAQTTTSSDTTDTTGLIVGAIAALIAIIAIGTSFMALRRGTTKQGA